MKIPGIFPILILASLVLGCGSDPDLATPKADPDPQTDRPTASGEAGDGEEVRGSKAPSGSEPAVEVLVTSDDDSLPDGCHPRQVAELVTNFFEAFNRGDQERLSRLFFISEGPSPPDFSEAGYEPWSWYSVSESGAGGGIERNFTTQNQGELLHYFAERHGQGERLHLLKVGLTGPGLLGERGNVGFLSFLTREADDFEPGLGGPEHIAFGKGGINCERRQIFAWSMEVRAGEERDARDAADWLCAEPPGWKPGAAVVACA